MNRHSPMASVMTAAAALAVLLMVRCSFAPFGGGTEGGNVSGVFMDDDGSVSAKVKVLLVPSDYNPCAADPDSPIVASTTASDGSYSFSNVAPGNYSIEAVHAENGKRSLITRVHVFEAEHRIPADTLHHPGAIRVFLPQTADIATGYVYVPGTTLYSRYTGTGGQVVLNDLPATSLPSIRYATLSDPTSVVLRYDVRVASNDTTVVANTGSKYARRLGLNTTATGAGVVRDVAGFPVLVRLTQENFPFWQANADGTDIRFARSDTVQLPYEIERWDADAGRAEVWVRVDTVFGNNDGQTLTMYWGASTVGSTGSPQGSATPSLSNGAAVFATADHFAAVWHLNRSGNDATSSGHDAVAISAIDTTGIIGPCKGFRGSDSITIAGLLGAPSSLTLSAWAQLDMTVPGGGSEILSLGDAVLIRMDYDLDSIGTIGAIHLPGDSTFFNVVSRRFLKMTGWHLVTYTIDQSAGLYTLYIDGAMVATRTDVTKSIVYSGVGQDTYIGKHGDGKTGFNFSGRIDEVRVCDAARNADWIKLCYMNQKAQDALVVFK